MTCNAGICDSSDVTMGQSQCFNANCNATSSAAPWCSNAMSFTPACQQNVQNAHNELTHFPFNFFQGTAMVDHSDPESHNIHCMTGVGGHGIMIDKVTNSSMDMIWDSEDDFETEGCAACPWAHNSAQDKEFAPVSGSFCNFLEPDDNLCVTIQELNDPNIGSCEDSGDGNPGACPLGQTIDKRLLKDGCAAETMVFGEACDSMLAVTCE